MKYVKEKFITPILKLKFPKIAVIVAVAAICLFVILHFFDRVPTNAVVDYLNGKIFTIRESTLNFLFKVAPLLITIVIAISSLTFNTYSGTYLELFLNDKKIKFFITYSMFYLAFHILVIIFIHSSQPGNVKLLNNYLIENFIVYLIDFLLAAINGFFTIYTAYKVFQYSWPITLKQKFLTNIKNTLLEVENSPVVDKEQINLFKTEITQQIGLFINLMLKAIKSKDYDSTRDTLNDIALIWKEIVSYTNDTKRDQDDLDFTRILERVVNDHPDLGLQFDYAGDIYEIGLSKIAHVFSDSFEIAFSNGEYYICDIILESVYNLIHLDKINTEDIRKCLKIFVEIFNISLRFDKKGQTFYFSEKTLSYINNIYNETKFKDFDIYYDILIICLKLDDPNILKQVLSSFKEIFDSIVSTDEIPYKDTITQFQGTLFYCLKNKRMKCFAELIRFFVIGEINLDIVNQVFSEKIIIIKKDLELLQRLLDELTDTSSDVSNTYNSENYIRVKLFIIWYCYYLLQCRISKERIQNKYRKLVIPDKIKNKVPFEIIRTVLLDIETHQSNWKKLFVGQESFYFPQVAVELLNTAEHEKVKLEVDEYGNSELLKRAKELLKL
jgi:hypothetical protein